MAFVGKITSGSTTAPVGHMLYGICEDAASVKNKTANVDGLDALIEGITIVVAFTHSNTAAAPTLNVNGLGAKEIRRANNAPVGANIGASWMTNSVVPLTYNGTRWLITGWLNTNTEYDPVTNNRNGLMISTDKVKLDAINIITKTDAVIASSSWTADDTYDDYPFKADITVTGATTDYMPIVTFSAETIAAYSPAPIASTGTNTVSVWVAVKPSGSISIPCITLLKGVSANAG